MRHQALALRWARALFDKAKVRGVVGQVQNDLAGVLQSWRSQEPLWGALAHPLINPPLIRELLGTAYKNKIHDSTLGFLELLALKRRLAILAFVVQHFDELADRDSGIVRASVRSAFSMTDGERSQLESSLERFYKKHSPAAPKDIKVILDVKEEPNLIAGLVVRVGDWVLEHNLASQLQQLKEKLSA